MQPSPPEPRRGDVSDLPGIAVLPDRAQATEMGPKGAVRRRFVPGFDSRNASSRSFNLIRSKLLGLRRDNGSRLIGFVSATPNVGKSFVSSNIAAAMSRDPRYQTYLIDLDLRRGTIKDVFGIQPEDSVLEYLLAETQAKSLRGYVPPGQNLIVIPSNAAEVPSAELLASERAQALFRDMRRSSEKNYFVCDLPPVFANDDAAIIMESLDAYVIVAEDGKTNQREIEATAQMLGHTRLAGVILNKYRGGLVSEGYGVEDRYASGYYGEMRPQSD